ncbi:MAG: type II toxin-antitoxin system HicB family antitoxin [Trueperaceae bacterium]
MSSSILTYRGYVAKIAFDAEDRTFYGDVVDLADAIHFRGDTVGELEDGFRDAVDAYLEQCEAAGREPDRPYSGRIQLRIPQDVHRRAARVAADAGVSLNDLFLAAIEARIEREDRSEDRPSVTVDGVEAIRRALRDERF